jgi:hypothetical protein
MATDDTIKALTAYHQLDTLARKAIQALDTKIEEADSDTTLCRVDSLGRIRDLMEFQRSCLSDLVEQTLKTNDQLEELMTLHGIKMP